VLTVLSLISSGGELTGAGKPATSSIWTNAAAAAAASLKFVFITMEVFFYFVCEKKQVNG
jgi:hypothetical protein